MELKRLKKLEKNHIKNPFTEPTVEDIKSFKAESLHGIAYVLKRNVTCIDDFENLTVRCLSELLEYLAVSMKKGETVEDFIERGKR